MTQLSGTILRPWKEVPLMVGMTALEASIFLPTAVFSSNTLLAYVNIPKKDLLLAKVHTHELDGYMSKREQRQACQKGKLRESVHRTYFLGLSVSSGSSPTPSNGYTAIIQSSEHL